MQLDTLRLAEKEKKKKTPYRQRLLSERKSQPQPQLNIDLISCIGKYFKKEL